MIFYHILIKNRSKLEGAGMYKVDVKKIMALKKAGWETEEIASEMHMEPDTVDKLISGSIEMKKENKKLEQKQENKTEEKRISIISLTPEQLKEIYEEAAAIGAKEALNIFEKERKKEYNNRKNRRLRNTKLLLKNYHMLKEHAENSVFGRTQMEESALDILESMMSIYDNEVIIESIKRSATRTAVIVSHIETMFGLYATYCDNSQTREIDMRRYEVIWDMYMAENILSVKEIAEKQHMSKDTIYMDLKVAIERLTALIFGVDGLKVR